MFDRVEVTMNFESWNVRAANGGSLIDPITRIPGNRVNQAKTKEQKMNAWNLIFLTKVPPQLVPMSKYLLRLGLAFIKSVAQKNQTFGP